MIREVGLFFVVSDWKDGKWQTKTPWYCSSFGDFRVEISEGGMVTEEEILEQLVTIYQHQGAVPYGTLLYLAPSLIEGLDV